jgi:glyceraldehyde 3-phosphate dehydrogenase
MINVAINGLGRIGRTTLRQILKDKAFNLIAVNDLSPINNVAHLLKYDSIYGPAKERIEVEGDKLLLNKKTVHYFQERNPSAVNWGKMGVDLVIDCTGIYTSYSQAEEHLKSGAKSVILSYPTNDEKIKNIVLGVNENTLESTDLIVSNASCTTNCSAPIINLLHDFFSVKRGFLTTIHAYTADQRLNDSNHSDLRRARAAAVNIIPTKTGAGQAINRVIPGLKNKISSGSFRVPVITGSCIELLVELEKQTTAQEVNKRIKNACKSKLKGIVLYSEDELVSTDIIGNAHSAVFDAKLTEYENGLLKTVAWYDNEFGYSQRLLDLAKHINKKH